MQYSCTHELKMMLLFRPPPMVAKLHGGGTLSTERQVEAHEAMDLPASPPPNDPENKGYPYAPPRYN